MPGLPLHASITALLAACLLPLGGLRAQEPGGESEVAGKRAAFEANVAMLLEPLNRKYAAALRKREKELAIAKDYEAAIALRDERLAVEAMLAKAGPTAVAANDTDSDTGAGTDIAAVVPSAENVYAAADARVLNGAEKDEDGVRLSEAGQAAEWAVTGLPAGGYEVIVTYSCAAASEFQVKEHFFRLTCAAPAGEGTETEKTESFGTLKITSRATVLTLTADRIAPNTPLIIHEMKLVSNRG